MFWCWSTFFSSIYKLFENLRILKSLFLKKSYIWLIVFLHMNSSMNWEEVPLGSKSIILLLVASTIAAQYSKFIWLLFLSENLGVLCSCISKILLCGIWVYICIHSLGYLVSPLNLKHMSVSSWKYAWIILLIIFLYLFSSKSNYLVVGSSDITIVSFKNIFHPLGCLGGSGS